MLQLTTRRPGRRALPALGRLPGLGHQRGHHRPHAGGLRAGAGAALPRRPRQRGAGASAVTAGDVGRPALVPATDNWTTRLRGRLSTVVPPGAGAARTGSRPTSPPGSTCSACSPSRRWSSSLVSGALLAVGGVGVVAHLRLGHFVNSTHLWSVELFFAFMVIHLWGKFWMAAWRGHRALTWVTGVVAFVGLDRHGVHRLPVAVELRLPVDQRRGQGRPQLGRHRRLVQRAEPRPDAAVARRAAAARRSACSSCCTSCWSAATASCRRSTPSEE